MLQTGPTIDNWIDVTIQRYTMELVTFSFNLKFVFMTHWEKWVHFIRPLRPGFVTVTSWRSTSCLFDFFLSGFPNVSQKSEYKWMRPNCYRHIFSFYVFIFFLFTPLDVKSSLVCFVCYFLLLFFFLTYIYIHFLKKGMDNRHLEQEIIDTKPLVLYNFDANNCKSISTCQLIWNFLIKR